MKTQMCNGEISPRAPMTFSEPSAKSYRWALVAIVAMAVMLRVALLVPGFGRLDDPDNYLKLAQSIVRGQGLAMKGRLTAYRPPLYPIVLAPLVAALGDRVAWGIAGLHVALGGATVLVTALAATRWGLPPARVLIAAAIVACDPVLAAQARTVMTETLAATLVAATLAILAGGTIRAAGLGGVAFGLASLCRPSFLPAATLAALATLAFGPGTLGVRIRRTLLLAMATIAILVPWAWRNARIFGEPVWTTTHGGYTLALANNPVYYAEVLHGRPGAVWSGPNQRRWFREMNEKVAGLGEPDADRWNRAEALRMLWERPVDFAQASLARLGRFWGVAPAGAVYSGSLRAVSAVWTVPLWAALVVGLTRRSLWRWPEVAAPAFVVALSLVHALYWTDLRMRAPIVPAIALIAAAAGPPFLARNATMGPPSEKL